MKLSWLKKELQPKPPAVPKPPQGFVGRFYNQYPNINWAPYIPMPSGPINYLEIGCADGGNAIIVSKSYAKHPNSKLYCVDPWMDYDEYPEYKGHQETAWETFNRNIQTCSDHAKFVIKRGLSDDIVPAFPNDFFDLIFVDGNHETEYVYRDGLMSLKKVKIGGYIVFDDYIHSWTQTVAGIKKFIQTVGPRIQVVADLYSVCGQLIVQRVA
jgi:predicted O-methyltransferase YrrM